MTLQMKTANYHELIAEIISLFIFILLLIGINYYQPLRNLDYQIDHQLQGIRSCQLTILMVFITDLGTWGVAIVALIGGIILIILKKWHQLIVWITTFLGNVVLSESIKLLVARTRPPLPHLVNVLSLSFPSGHAMNSLVGYGITAYYLSNHSRLQAYKPLIIILWIFLFISIGFSRLYLGVHYLSDVIAGYAIGAVWLITCIRWKRSVI